MFPYVMYFNRTVEVDGVKLNEFKYSFPLGKDEAGPNESALLMYFNEETMDLNKIVMKANSLNITNPLTLFASQPVTETKLDKDQMSFPNVTCKKVSDSEQEKLNHYVKRIYELVKQTK